ncbi:hypothetical protein [Streptomyces sp. NBC_00096]
MKFTHEVLTGHPVECLAEAAEHALALVVVRRGGLRRVSGAPNSSAR